MLIVSESTPTVLSIDINNSTVRCVRYSDRVGSLIKLITVASITCVLDINSVTYIISVCTALCLYE